jgi:hypothetical protein
MRDVTTFNNPSKNCHCRGLPLRQLLDSSDRARVEPRRTVASEGSRSTRRWIEAERQNGGQQPARGRVHRRSDDSVLHMFVTLHQER